MRPATTYANKPRGEDPDFQSLDYIYKVSTFDVADSALFGATVVVWDHLLRSGEPGRTTTQGRVPSPGLTFSLSSRFRALVCVRQLLDPEWL